MVIGDAGVGKTCLLISYTTNSFPTTYTPTVFDNYTANAIVDGQAVNLGLWDTAGSDEFDGLRPLSYSGTDVFLICFDLTDEVSLNNIKFKWLEEIRKEEGLEDIPVIIVGTKLDLRDDAEAVEKITSKGRVVVTTDMGFEFKKKTGT